MTRLSMWVRDGKETPVPAESFRAEPGRELTRFYTPTHKQMNEVFTSSCNSSNNEKLLYCHSPAGLEPGGI